MFDVVMHLFAPSTRLMGLALVVLAGARLLAADAAPPHDFAAVEALFAKHCLDCHAAQDPEGKLVLETFDALMKGGESGPVVVPGKSAESLIVKAVETGLDRDGKKKLMPPGKRRKLQPEEIAVLKGWIDTGAPAPKETGRPAIRELVVPKVTPSVPPRRSIQALAYADGPKLLAVARYGEVELRSAETRVVVRTLTGHRGAVNALAFSTDGKWLAAAGGEAGWLGEARLWNVADGALVRTFEGHKDALYAVAISPDGKTLATGSYDQKIKLWNLDTGELLHTLSAHNGAIFDLAFRPDGRILASASGDRTVKLWNVATGKRVETLNQPLKEQYAVAWSPDGQRLAAAGVDNRIRVWEVSDSAAETTNPLLVSKFGHEGAILNLLYAPDGKTLLSSAEDRAIKLWNAAGVTETLSIGGQPDLAPGLAFGSGGKTFAVGRLDGSLEIYDATSGKVVPPAAPELISLQPRGLQRGTAARIKFRGRNLLGITNVVFSNSKLSGELIAADKSDEATVNVTAAAGLPRAAYEISVAGPNGASGKLKLFIDDLPQVYEPAKIAEALPVSFWGALDKPGESDEFSFDAKAGQMLVLDLAVKSIDAKITNGSLSLLNAHGAVLETDSGFDGGDRFIALRIPADGHYTARIADQMLGASKDHFFRLSVGALPIVTGAFPLSVGTNAEVDVELSGVNLPANAKAHLKTEGPGEVAVPIDTEKFRTRRAFKVLVAEGPQLIEREPNDKPAETMALAAPGVVNGRIERAGDADLFRFDAKAGDLWIIETDAAGRSSPIDTKIEVLHADGRPVARMLLQAVRNTAINFRGVDSNATGMRLDNYEEMELNEYLYLNGDVMRLFRMPQGPDSDMLMYASAGKRRAYFDTTAVAHALDEQGFIIEAQPLGAKLAATGLPVFTLDYENDDDGERKLGSDSKLQFTAPTNGSYLVRVSDNRGHGGDLFAYRLIVREATPDFTVTLSGANPTVSPGSGQSFTLNAERLDGFDGDIRVEITGLPAGFTVSTPIVIEAGHTEAKGTIHAPLDAPKPEGTNAAVAKVTATAAVNGKTVRKDVNSLGTIKLGDKPKLYVSLEPYSESATNHFDPAEPPTNPLELTLAPGQRIPAWIKIKRNGHADLVTFFVENLPHGVIVDDIGLNGVLIPKGEDERQIFLTAAKWVQEQDRLCYAIEQQAGKQTSPPVLLKVRKPRPAQAASAK
jgi:WD40 repeat protein/mono/diheme cytochrome c family protein